MATGLPVVVFCCPFNGLVSGNIYKNPPEFVEKSIEIHDLRNLRLRFPFIFIFPWFPVQMSPWSNPLTNLQAENPWSHELLPGRELPVGTDARAAWAPLGMTTYSLTAHIRKVYIIYIYTHTYNMCLFKQFWTYVMILIVPIVPIR